MWDLSFLTRDQTLVLCTEVWGLNHWTAGEVPKETHLCTAHPLWPKHQNKMSLLESEVHRKDSVTNNRHRTVKNSIPSVLGKT